MDTRARLQQALTDRYSIDREIGSGGMAVVYLAQDLKHHRNVAIKVLRPELSVAMGPERFLREIEVAAQLNHPNILGLHDSGEADGLLYFVMPFVEGESLRQRLDREGRLSLDDAVRVTCEVGSALGYAQTRGVVHRDIKPENILFLGGQALVCDFGIAKAASDAQDRLTQTGLAVGTFRYMSPEQAAGEGEIDGRTDLYALGCMLHEMLSGDAPFVGSTPQAVLAQKLVGTPSDLSIARPDVPATVQDVIGRALAKSRDDRYETAEQFTSALTHATTETAVEKDTRRRRRRRLSRGAAMLGAVATVSAGAWWLAAVLGGPPIERVALLPLANTQRDTAQDFFMQGMHEDLVKELTYAGIRAINTNSVRGYAGTDERIRDIAADLGVDGVIMGTATLQRGLIEVELTLWDGTSEESRWIQSFNKEVRDVTSLYRDVTMAIADELEVDLSEEALARLAMSAPIDPLVFEALLQARFHYQKLTEKGLNTAMAYYELALSIDSTSVEAWIGTATVWGGRAQQGLISGEEAARLGAAAMARAAALDPEASQDPASLAGRLTWGEWNWTGAEVAFLKAIEKDPTDSRSRVLYSQLLFYLGRVDEAMEQAELAAEMDPFNALVQGFYAQDLIFLRRYADAEAVLLRTLEREPAAPYPLSTLRTAYHLMGRHEDAIEAWRESYDSWDDAEAVEALDRGYREGGYATALESVAELFIERMARGEARPWQIGTLYTRAGRSEEALRYLELAYEEHDQNMPSIAVDPIFDFLRDEPRFQALLDRLGLPG
jgi:serine/threonine-protein kinase